jgi:hypothetical protein
MMVWRKVRCYTIRLYNSIHFWLVRVAVWDSHCKYYQDWMLNAAVGAVLVPYGSFLKFISTCGCLKGRDFFKNNCVGAWCSSTVDYFGAQTLSVALGKPMFYFLLLGYLCLRICFAALNLILVAWAVFETYKLKIGFDIFKTFVLSKLWSMVEWFVWATPYFSYRYPVDRRHFYKRLEPSVSRSYSVIALNPISSTRPPSR